MTPRPATAVGAVVLVAIGVSAAPSRAAAPATITGKLAPGAVKLPKSARKGSAQVTAMNVDTLAFGAAAQVGKRGRYKLKLPAGKWALRSSVVALGKPFASFPSARIVTRPGKRRSLPLTLKRFKHPRRAKTKRRHHRARRANINPRDGRPYKGEAIGIERFSFVGSDAEVGQLGRGIPEMLITDLLTHPKCEFTLIEVMRRGEILNEHALSQSEYVDPASRIEPGHLIDPELLLRGRVEDRPGTPHRLALFAWLVDAKTGAKVSGDVSSVTLAVDWSQSEERLAQLVQRDLICARAAKQPPRPPPAAAPGPTTSAPPTEPPVCPPGLRALRSACPGPPPPPAAPNAYTGTFSGEADSEAGYLHWTWSGTVAMDAAQDDSQFPPNGAPAGTYRVFTVTSGSVDINVMANPPSGCVFTGSKHLDVEPGLINTLTMQLDDASPAYALQITGSIMEQVATVQSGSNCPGIATSFGIFPIWASTGTTAHTSPTLTLADSQAELTPQTPVDYDYTTRWNLAPG